MPDHFILMGIGGAFVILGMASMFWGNREAKGYYDAVSDRSDVREFLEHDPERPEPGALRIGGWIAVAVGLLMLIMGSIFWLLG